MCWVKRMDLFNGICFVCNSGVYSVNTTSVRLVTIVKKVGGGGQIISLVPTPHSVHKFQGGGNAPSS